ncbi:MAG: transposase [Magnetococcales bacterium]|nr:transposase [Magnetococcales bacterium]
MEKSRGGWTTKIHAGVDAHENLLRIFLTGNQAHDITKAEELLDGFCPGKVIADKTYDADGFIAIIRNAGAERIIPSKSNQIDQQDYDLFRKNDVFTNYSCIQVLKIAIRTTQCHRHLRQALQTCRHLHPKLHRGYAARCPWCTWQPNLEIRRPIPEDCPPVPPTPSPRQLWHR